MSRETGTRVRNTVSGETGVITGRLSFGLRIDVDVDRGDWARSVIGPPSRITAVWESWICSTDLNPETEEDA